MWTLYWLQRQEEKENFAKNQSVPELVPDSHRHKYFQRHPTSGFLLSSVAGAWRVNSDLRSEKLLTAPEFDEAPEADGCHLALK